jgi:hypothetical protein
MGAQQTYLVIVLVPLAVIAGLLILTKKIKPESKLSPIAGLSFAFIIAAIVFAENRFIGYALIGIGVLLAIVDIIRKFKK